ncbi:hypothetical protein FO519_000761 [Halicephalobus sp. NKZ332]|nr:hypothetical protein FO519_000761 [Halicephalobus sp. NKZ332]
MSTENEHSEVSTEESDVDSPREVTQRIVLHVYNDESKEFSSLTTYHGMVRIYNSSTWPSLIFWCLVVVSCVSLFMVHSGSLLHFYVSRPTFLDTKQMETQLPPDLIPVFSFCSRIRGSSEMNSWKKFNCVNQFHSVFWNQKKVENFCEDHVQRKVTKSGVCYKISNLQIQPSDEFTAVIPNSADYDLSFGISKGESNFSTTELFIPQGMQLNLEITVRSRVFLDRSNWGKCENDVSEIPDCEQDCLRREIIRFCSCLPYYLIDGTNVLECTTESSKICLKNALKREKNCDCQLPCNRTTYEVVRNSLLRLPNRNFSKINVRFHNKRWIFEQQKQRFRTIDVLCWVGGSMGLFLGMSCVTLMEVFMFLFKSIWGITNNQRHKDYLSNLLGENVTGFLNEDEEVRGSHEKIVITQTLPEGFLAMLIPRQKVILSPH